MLEIGSLFQPTQERQERLESDVNHSTLLELLYIHGREELKYQRHTNHRSGPADGSGKSPKAFTHDRRHVYTVRPLLCAVKVNPLEECASKIANQCVEHVEGVCG